MTAPMAVGRMAMMGEDEGEKPEMESAKPACPKCGAEMECPRCEGEGESDELTPSQENDVKSWFEANDPKAQMRGAMR